VTSSFILPHFLFWIFPGTHLLDVALTFKNPRHSPTSFSNLDFSSTPRLILIPLRFSPRKKKQVSLLGAYFSPPQRSQRNTWPLSIFLGSRPITSIYPPPFLLVFFSFFLFATFCLIARGPNLAKSFFFWNCFS